MYVCIGRDDVMLIRGGPKTTEVPKTGATSRPYGMYIYTHTPMHIYQYNNILTYIHTRFQQAHIQCEMCSVEKIYICTHLYINIVSYI